jgi:hypothetical protein
MFRVPENVLFFGLGVAAFAVISVLSSEQSAITQYYREYQGHTPAQNRPPGQSAPATNSAPLQPLPGDRGASGQSRNTGEKESEFWSAKLTDWLLAAFTLALVVFTRRLYLATAGLFTETAGLREAAGQQVRDMQQSISEAARSAAAMERVAEHIETSARAAVDSVVSIKERTAMQMRAYLAVVVFQAIYQERDKQLRFEVKPLIVNTGHTPAHNVRYHAKADILPLQLPDDFDFSLTALPWVGGSVIGAQHNAIMSAVVDRYVDDNEIASIKRGTGTALRIWGQVLYQDVFGEEHFTNFHQILNWIGPPENELVFGMYPPRNNDAN